MIIFIICLFIGIYFIYRFYKENKGTTKNNLLATDMEIYIAQLEIRPKANKNIKKVASYLESVIMPNEKLLAVDCAGSIFGTNFAIVTDKRVIFENKSNGVEIITPIEKIGTVIQNGTIVNVNQNWIDLLSVNKANRIVNLINKQISSIQTVQQAIKIENKIITEETITSQLKKLSDLHDAKVLTDFEYSMKKQELLDKMK